LLKSKDKGLELDIAKIKSKKRHSCEDLLFKSNGKATYYREYEKKRRKLGFCFYQYGRCDHLGV
jgi:hypothetical protein